MKSFVLLIRWGIASFCFYMVFIWQGHEPPVIDTASIQISEGKLSCPTSTSRRSPSAVAGIKYMNSFGFTFGIQGGASGCPALQGRTAIVWWLPIYEGRQRLLLQVMDKEKQQIYGNTKEQNLRNYLYDVQDKYGLYFAKLGFFLLAISLIFFKPNQPLSKP
jgi:hypothetical protein